MHRIDGTAAKCEVNNLVLTGTSARGSFAVVDGIADEKYRFLGDLRASIRTSDGEECILFDEAFESWSEDPE